MTLRPYKFVVKAIPQIIDDNGDVLGEELGVNQVELFGCAALEAWAREFPDKLQAADKPTAA